MLSYELGNTNVVIVGTSRFSNNDSGLHELLPVENNVDDLESIFIDKSIIGISPSNVHKILNPNTGSFLLRKLSFIAERTRDTLIFYYSGHGLRSDRDEGVFIATSDTTQSHCNVDGVNIDHIARIVGNSPASKKILIIDCCYSGSIFRTNRTIEMGIQIENEISDAVDIEGVYTITSSAHNRKSYTLDGQRHSIFTGVLISVLKEGVDSQSDYLTIDNIFSEIKKRMRRIAGSSVPKNNAGATAGNFLLAKNSRRALDPILLINNLKLENQQLADRLLYVERNNTDIENQISIRTSEFMERISKLEDKNKKLISKNIAIDNSLTLLNLDYKELTRRENDAINRSRTLERDSTELNRVNKLLKDNEKKLHEQISDLENVNLSEKNESMSHVVYTQGVIKNLTNKLESAEYKTTLKEEELSLVKHKIKFYEIYTICSFVIILIWYAFK